MILRIVVGCRLAESVAGMPARVTSFQRAEITSSSEALVVITRGRVRSVVARPGEMTVYLSPRAEYRVVAATGLAQGASHHG